MYLCHAALRRQCVFVSDFWEMPKVNRPMADEVGSTGVMGSFVCCNVLQGVAVCCRALQCQSLGSTGVIVSNGVATMSRLHKIIGLFCRT